jgi:hypothetical protein
MLRENSGCCNKKEQPSPLHNKVVGGQADNVKRGKGEGKEWGLPRHLPRYSSRRFLFLLIVKATSL